MKKFITMAILLVFLSSVLTPLSVSSNTGPTFAAGSRITAQQGRTVTVPITVSNNPGFAAVGLVITFDPLILELTRVEAPVPELPLNNFALSSTQGTQWISLVDNQIPKDWKSPTGIVANLFFNVKSNAATGNSSVNIGFTSPPRDGTPVNEAGDVLSGAQLVQGSVIIQASNTNGGGGGTGGGGGGGNGGDTGGGGGGNGTGGGDGTGGGGSGSGNGSGTGGGASPSPSPGPSPSPSPSPSPGVGEGGIRVITDFGTWTGSGTSIAKLDAEQSEFVRLMLDDNVVSETHYTVTTGSTVITLKEEYIKTLDDGTYKYRAEFTNSRYADLTLIVSSTFGNVPQTSVIDLTGSVVVMWASIFLTAFLSVYLYFHVKEKRRGKIFDILRQGK